MKLSNSSSFDVKDLPEILRKAKIQELEPLFAAITSSLSEVISAVRGKLTVSDNMLAIEKDIELKDGIDQVISTGDLPNGSARSIIVLKSMPYKNPVTSFAWEYTVDGKLRVRAKFEGAPTTACTVRVRIET